MSLTKRKEEQIENEIQRERRKKKEKKKIQQIEREKGRRDGVGRPR